MIDGINDEKREQMRKASVLGLPDNPKAHGINAADVKKAMVEPFIGVSEAEDANVEKTSIVEEINRIVGETNEAVKDIQDARTVLKNKDEIIKAAEGAKVAVEVATQASVDAQASAEEAKESAESVKSIIEGAPEELDTLKEIAEALGNDKDLATNLLKEIAKKLSIFGGILKGDLQIGDGHFLPDELDGAPVHTTRNYKLRLFAPTGNADAGEPQWYVIDISNPGIGEQYLRMGITGTGKLGQIEYKSDEEEGSAYVSLRFRPDGLYEVVKDINGVEKEARVYSPNNPQPSDSTKFDKSGGVIEDNTLINSKSGEGFLISRQDGNITTSFDEVFPRIIQGIAYGNKTSATPSGNVAQIKMLWNNTAKGMLIKEDGLYLAQSSTDTTGVKLATLNDLGNGGVTDSFLLSKIYPVGSIYMSTNSTSPASFLGGTWERIQDKFLLSAGSSYLAGSTGGSANAVAVEHKHNVISHNDTSVVARLSGTGSSYGVLLGTTTPSSFSDTIFSGRLMTGGALSPIYNSLDAIGESGVGKNMPPYLVVYMWKRIS